VLQAIPAVHATHVPLPSHTPPVHAVPAARCPVVPHTGPPLEQSVAPRSHGFDGLHAEPETHATQVPRPSHTPPLHAVPADAFDATTHCALPLEHSSVPSVHAFPVLHAMPKTHAKHVPAALHVSVAEHEPHVPPHPSSPQTRPAQFGVQASAGPVSTVTPVSFASVGSVVSGMSIATSCTSGTIRASMASMPSARASEPSVRPPSKPPSRIGMGVMSG
jgi:hypothetical protein